jgi:threonine dehydratase
MPHSASLAKIGATEGYGARVELAGDSVDDAVEAARAEAGRNGKTLVHPFDDEAVIAGHGTVGLEILEDLPEVDVVVVGIGGGGLISGTACALKETRPSVRVYGVEPTEAAAMTRAFEAGTPVPIRPQTVADGLAAPFASELTLAMCRRYLDEIVLLDDVEILSGVRFAMERLKQTLEPAGAAALAAVLHRRIPIRDGERVAVVASGGNLDLSRAAEFLAIAAPLPGTDAG